MKCVIFCLLLLSLHQGRLADEIDVNIRTNNIDTFLRRLLSRIENKEMKYNDVTRDKKYIMSPANGDLVCGLCIESVAYLEFLFNHSLTADYIQHYLLPTCNVFKPIYQKECIHFYQTNGLQMIKEILNNNNMISICQKNNFCPSNYPEVVVRMLKFGLPHYITDNQCTFCQNLYQLLEEVFDPAVSVDDIVQQLSNVCNTFNSTYQNDYRLIFNSNYIKLQILLFLTNIPPIKICQFNNACPSKNKEIKLKDQY